MQEVEGGGGDSSTLGFPLCQGEHEEYVSYVRDTLHWETTSCQELVIQAALSGEALLTLVKHFQLQELVISASLLSSRSVSSVIGAICGVCQGVAVDTVSEEYSKLTSLTITDINLSQISSILLSQAVTKLNTLSLGNTSLTLCQLETILTTVSEGSNLVNLDLSMNNLSSVNPRLLGRCATILNTLNLTNTSLTAEQIEAILEGVNGGNKLKNLNISQNNLESVKMEMLVRAVNNLESLNTQNCSMSPWQLEVTRPNRNGDHHIESKVVTEEPRLWESTVRKMKKVRLNREQRGVILSGIKNASIYTGFTMPGCNPSVYQ